MSFSDFGKRSPSTRPGSASSSSSSGRPTSSQGGSLERISETLLQYQRNVGILEKIVQALTARKTTSLAVKSNNNNNELDLQYKAQIDVLAQLQEKIERLLTQLKQQLSGSESSQKTTFIKLQRDFERVQTRVSSLQNVVEQQKKQQKEKQQQQQQQQSPSAAETANSSNNAGGIDHAQQMQIQMQEDRLHEEIMREREEEIRNINRGMHQVNEIYKDLAHIVGSQQEQIDSIENQMEDAKVNAESGLKQVEKANEKFGTTQCVIS